MSTRVDVEEIQTTKGEKLLAVVLAALPPDRRHLGLRQDRRRRQDDLAARLLVPRHTRRAGCRQRAAIRSGSALPSSGRRCQCPRQPRAEAGGVPHGARSAPGRGDAARRGVRQRAEAVRAGAAERGRGARPTSPWRSLPQPAPSATSPRSRAGRSPQARAARFRSPARVGAREPRSSATGCSRG